MKLARIVRLWPAAACAVALLGAGAPSVANADIVWTVNGVFDDGGALSGYFNINVYGFLDGYDLTTTAGGTQSGFDYTPSDSYFSNGAFYVDAQPGYEQDLHLAFSDPVSTPVAVDPIIGGEGGPSYECINSFSCYIPLGGQVRYLASGYASAGGGNINGLNLDPVPEPGVWAMLVIGFGALGGALRVARRRTSLA